MRISGWQRIGIMASIVWVLGAAIYTREDLRRKQNADYQAEFGLEYRRCRDIQDRDGHADRVTCHNQAAEAGRSAAQPYTRSKKLWLIALASLGPIPFGWLVAYLLFGIVRWAKLGF